MDDSEQEKEKEKEKDRDCGVDSRTRRATSQTLNFEEKVLLMNIVKSFFTEEVKNLDPSYSLFSIADS